MLRGALVLLLTVGCASRVPYMAPALEEAPPPASAVDHRLVLIGDSGEPFAHGVAVGLRP